MVPPGQGPPGGPPGPGGPVRPGTGRPTGTFAAPPPQVSYHGGPHYGPGVIPGVIPAPPGAPYTPTPSGSPVIPSPPSSGRDVFVPPEFHFRDSGHPPPHGIYQPPVPVPLGDEDMFIPPEPSPPRGDSRSPTRSETPSTEFSPRPGSGIPLVVPGPGQIFPQPLQQGLPPHPAGTQPPLLVYPPSHGRPPSRPTSRSTDRTRTPSPPLPVPPTGYPSAGPTIINIPGQTQQLPMQPQGPSVSFTPSTQHPDEGRGAQVPQDPSGAQPPVVHHVIASPEGRRSEYSYDDGRPDLPQQQQGQPIIIHPPHVQHTGVPMGPMGPMGPFPPVGPPGVILQHPPRDDRDDRSRSTTPTRSSRSRSPRSPRTPIILPGQQPGQFPIGLPPGGPIFPMPHGPGVGPGFGPGFGPPASAPPITVMAPSHPSYRPESPEYRPESPRSGFVPPSRTPTRYSDHPVHPVLPGGMVPTGVHIVPSAPYPGSRRGYSRSRTPSSERDREEDRDRERRRRRRRDRDRSPSTDTEEEERRRDRRRERRRRRREEDRSPSYSPRRREYSPSRVHPIPVSEFGHPGPSIIPPTVGHVIHEYPPGSPSYASRRSEGETEPLQHPYGPPSQYAPTEPILVPDSGRTPSGRAPRRRPSQAPTIVEVTGPEHIQVLPPGHPGYEHPPGETTRKFRTKLVQPAVD
jgi:hypothetical protein